MDEHGSRSTADQVVAGADLSGRVMVVTGANTGIGYETARALASAGARVILGCRNPATGQAAVDRILTAHPGCQVELGVLDLSSFDSVRAFGTGLDADDLAVVICNAGLSNGRYHETASGFEQVVGVSHLGHFLLVNELLPRLLNGGAGRVVMVSSESHRMPARLDFSRLPLTRDNYGSLLAYGQAKLCNVLFANELQRRHGEAGLTACALHPGTLVTTEIARDSLIGRVLMNLVSPFTKNTNQGAATSVMCAIHPDPAHVAGRYFSNCQPKRSSREANDPVVARRLWELSEQWTARA